MAGPVPPPGSPEPPTISVVVPCFNGVAHVGAALRSVLDQGWPALEVIVVDDGSTDGSAAWIRREFPGVTVIEQFNQGVAAARNRGIAAARGEWVAFLDADDVWLPGKLTAQMAIASATPETRMTYTAWAVWTSDAAGPETGFLHNLHQRAGIETLWIGPSGWIYPQLLLDCEVWTSTVLMQRSLLEEIGGFDTQLRIGEDYDLWLRASRRTQIIRVPRPLALYRQHPASITRSAPSENYRSVVVTRALTQWGYDDGHGPPANPAQVRRALAKSWSEFAAANLQAGHVDRARRAVWMSLRADPRHVGAWKALVKTALGRFAPRLEARP